MKNNSVPFLFLISLYLLFISYISRETHTRIKKKKKEKEKKKLKKKKEIPSTYVV